jgi:hypothetical protein
MFWFHFAHPQSFWWGCNKLMIHKVEQTLLSILELQDMTSNVLDIKLFENGNALWLFRGLGIMIGGSLQPAYDDLIISDLLSTLTPPVSLNPEVGPRAL